MATYVGKASIRIDDGSSIDDVEVSLVSSDDPGATERWFGTITGDFDAFDLMDGTPVLCLPGGAEAPFRLTRTDLVLPRHGLDVVGVGAPPF